MDPDGTRSLAELFQINQGSIGVSKRINLFREMDENPLTKEEQDIIQKRVQAQRDMFEEYERREKKRKVSLTSYLYFRFLQEGLEMRSMWNKVLHVLSSILQGSD